MPITVLYGKDTGDDIVSRMGTGQFKGVKSEYIRKKIRTTPFKNRAYIYNLITMYNYMVNGVGCWASSYAYGMLRSRYPKELSALLKENDPKQHRETVERCKALKAKAREDACKESEKERNTVALQRREWAAAGGK